MAAGKSEIRSWLEEAKLLNATHLVVVCDTFDFDDYPVYVKPPMSIEKILEDYDGKEMQKVMEVYKLDMDIEAQLAERRAFHL